MTDTELKLKDYLSKHPDVIEQSLKDHFFHYDCIIVTEVEIDDDNYFSVKCLITKYSNTRLCSKQNPGAPITSPFITIPEKFLRKIKLEKIHKLNLSTSL